jgi:hypothetical protein
MSATSASFEEIRERARRGDGGAERILDSLYARIARRALADGDESMPLARVVRGYAQRIAWEHGLELPRDREEVIRRLAPLLSHWVVTCPGQGAALTETIVEIH